MKRHRDLEKLQATTRSELPRVAVQWLAAVREPLQALTQAALDPQTADWEFLALVEAFSQSLPDLIKTMDHDSLAKLMEESMGAAMGNGIAAREQQS